MKRSDIMRAILIHDGKIKPIINLSTNKVYDTTGNAAKELDLKNNAILRACKTGKPINGITFAFLGEDNKPKIVEYVPPVPRIKKEKKEKTQKPIIKYLAWRHDDTERKEAKIFNGLQELQEGLKSKLTHLIDVVSGKRSNIGGWKIAVLDENMKPILTEKHFAKAKKIMRQIICLNDNKIFNNSKEAANFYKIGKGAAAHIALGKAIAVKNKETGERLRFAFIEGDQVKLTAAHSRPIEKKCPIFKYIVKSPDGSQGIYSDLATICKEIGFSKRHLNKYFKNPSTYMTGYTIIREKS